MDKIKLSSNSHSLILYNSHSSLPTLMINNYAQFKRIGSMKKVILQMNKIMIHTTFVNPCVEHLYV